MSIKIIGTGHILQKSVNLVKETIDAEKPGIVAVELDKHRYEALESANWDLDSAGEGLTWRGGSFPVIFRKILGMIQKEMGKKLGISAGSDMKAAVFSARKIDAKLALIDRNIELTMNHLLAAPFSEKINLILLNPEIDIMNIEGIVESENLNKIMDELRNKVPNVYGALVDERDQYMAYSLAQLQCQNPEANIIAVVGAGHKRGIEKYLQILYEIDMKKIMKPKRASSLQIIPLLFVVIVAYILMKIWFFRK